MSDIWMQSKFGHAHDLVDPSNNAIDFHEIAETLANINRYNGCGQNLQCSVAQHTLIGMTACESELLPWWLLHDCHEAFIGDITTPTAQALSQIADEVFWQSCNSSGAGSKVRLAISELKYRHDVAIHKAAGLPMPTIEQSARIKEIDIICLLTERRDFLAMKPKDWHPSIEAMKPLPVETDYMPPGIAARALLRAFWRHLPNSKVVTHGIKAEAA